MDKNKLPIPSPGEYNFSGGRLYAGKLVCPSHAGTVEIVNVRLSGAGEAVVRVETDAGMGSGYEIELTETGIRIRGGGQGIYSAFSVLAALAGDSDSGYGSNGGNSWFPLGTISARPRYEYRGIMLDVSRHFFPKEEVMRLLDIMFRLRLNKFHWHIADDQGFRIALKNYPKLEEISSKRAYTARGGFGGGRKNDGIPYSGCYQEEDVREILAYAAVRGIEVIPELDMPGHMSAIIAAYPELSCGGEALAVPGDFGILDNVLCIGNDAALEFMGELVHALCDLFEAKTFHIGFDEVKLKRLKTCPKCRARMRSLGIKRVAGLKTYAKDRIKENLQKRGIRVIMYNDGMTEADPSVVCYHWLSIMGLLKKTIRRINQGQPAILANFSYLYMDYPYALTPLKKTYQFNPHFRDLTKPENILGLEAPLWTEFVEDHGKLAFNAYYRMAALAEVAWCGEARRSYSDFLTALRGREKYYFGEELKIPGEILDPPRGLARIGLLKKCLTRDMNAEYRLYRNQREKN
ncbi:MAG: family 20 glycosylhydrolase [Treponema sp.]|jgi:hexosaminidase|nr:family 20 glycosylhydrolase [Treponema sp.]